MSIISFWTGGALSFLLPNLALWCVNRKATLAGLLWQVLAAAAWPIMIVFIWAKREELLYYLHAAAAIKENHEL